MSTPPVVESMDPRTALLLRAWEFEHAAQTKELRAMLEVLPRGELLDEPELGVLLLNGYVFTLATDEARVLERELRPFVEARGNDRLHRRFVNFQGILFMRESAFSQAEGCFRRVASMSTHTKDDLTLSSALTNLGFIDTIRFRGSDALLHFARALALARGCRDSRFIASVFYGTAMAYRDMEMYPEAQRDFETVRRYQRNEFETAYVDVEEALLMLEIGRQETASRLAERARNFFASEERWVGAADASRVLAKIAMSTGDLESAKAELEYARSVFPGLDLVTEAELYEEFAVLAAMQDDTVMRVRSEERAARLYTSVECGRRAERMRRRLARLTQQR